MNILNVVGASSKTRTLVKIIRNRQTKFGYQCSELTDINTGASFKTRTLVEIIRNHMTNFIHQCSGGHKLTKWVNF